MAKANANQPEIQYVCIFQHEDGVGGSWQQAEQSEQTGRVIIDDDEATRKAFGTKLAKQLNRVGEFNSVSSLGNGYDVARSARTNSNVKDTRIYGHPTPEKDNYYKSKDGEFGYYNHFLWKLCGGTCFCFFCTGVRCGDDNLVRLQLEMLQRLPAGQLVAVVPQAPVTTAHAPPLPAAALPPQPKCKATQPRERMDSTVDNADQSEEAPRPRPIPIRITVPAAEEASLGTTQPQGVSKRKRALPPDEEEDGTSEPVAKKNQPDIPPPEPEQDDELTAQHRGFCRTFNFARKPFGTGFAQYQGGPSMAQRRRAMLNQNNQLQRSDYSPGTFWGNVIEAATKPGWGLDDGEDDDDDEEDE